MGICLPHWSGNVVWGTNSPVPPIRSSKEAIGARHVCHLRGNSMISLRKMPSSRKCGIPITINPNRTYTLERIVRTSTAQIRHGKPENEVQGLSTTNLLLLCALCALSERLLPRRAVRQSLAQVPNVCVDDKRLNIIENGRPIKPLYAFFKNHFPIIL